MREGGGQQGPPPVVKEQLAWPFSWPLLARIRGAEVNSNRNGKGAVRSVRLIGSLQLSTPLPSKRAKLKRQQGHTCLQQCAALATHAFSNVRP